MYQRGTDISKHGSVGSRTPRIDVLMKSPDYGYCLSTIQSGMLRNIMGLAAHKLDIIVAVSGKRLLRDALMTTCLFKEVDNALLTVQERVAFAVLYLPPVVFVCLRLVYVFYELRHKV